jgi:aminoglycoside phosphotransferase (APT) family kinase protein
VSAPNPEPPVVATEPEADTRPIGAVRIDETLVRRLLEDQFPHWAHLPVRPVASSGWDNRTFHLGEDMTVRLPSAEGYAPQVAKEHRWLPWLAPRLPLPIPTPLALGVPGSGFPWNWSVYAWLEGETASSGHIADLPGFAGALGNFLAALQRVDASEGPLPGVHSAFRGAPLNHYDGDVRRALELLSGDIDVRRARAVWEAALETVWAGAPVWFHGDVALGNLLVKDGELGAVIDFGCSGVGDPACDLVIAWTFFSGESDEAFRSSLPLEEATWARGRGWALWKALIVLARLVETNAVEAANARSTIARVIEDHERTRS